MFVCDTSRTQADVFSCGTCLCPLNGVFYVSPCQGQCTQSYGLSLHLCACIEGDEAVDGFNISLIDDGAHDDGLVEMGGGRGGGREEEEEEIETELA